MTHAPSTPWVAASVDELAAGAHGRVEVRPADARSGARFERFTVDGQRRFLKVLTAADDWIMRMTGNTTNWEFQVWRAGIYQQLPACLDHTVLGMALEGSGPSCRPARSSPGAGGPSRASLRGGPGAAPP